MAGLPQDPEALVPQALGAEDAAEFERRVGQSLREAMMGGRGGLVEIDAIDLVGSRPDTSVVFRYHHREQYVGHAPGVDAGPRAEVARLWEFAIDPDDRWSRGFMDSPGVLAAAIGSAFDAAELTLVDPETLVPIGQPAQVFPRLYDLPTPKPTPKPT